MTRIIAATHLKRGLSQVLRDVDAGEDVIVAVRGKPVARLTRVPREPTAAALAAVASELERLPVRDLPGWRRSDLYEG